MLKELIKLYIQSRLNAIDAEIESLADKLIEEEESSERSVIAQAVFDYSAESKNRIKKLTRKVMLYQLIFGEIK